MLKDYPVIVDIVVRWGDMDALGHVNNIIYLQYFETARIEYLMRLGMDPPGATWQETGLIIASVTCRFLAPVTFPDTLSVGARVSSLGRDRLVMEHAAVSQKLGKLAAKGEALVVSYNYAAGERASLPQSITQAIRAIEGRDIPSSAGRSRQLHQSASD